ncbi:MAG TPA: PAS domain S-box protein [Candidatus Xenobia bacterium]
MSDRYRAVVELAPTAIVMIDAEGRIVLVNTQTERLFGYPRSALLGQPVEMLVPDRFQTPHAGYRQAFVGQPASRLMGAGRELFGKRQDGSEVPIEIGLNPIQTEDGLCVLAVIADISERQRAAEQFKVAVESAPNAMVMADAEGRIVLVNRQTERLFGYQRQELMGASIETLVPTRFRAAHPGYRTHFLVDPQARPMGAGRDLFGLRKAPPAKRPKTMTGHNSAPEEMPGRSGTALAA